MLIGYIAGIIFTALVAIHIAVAIKHQLAKDGVSQRMLFESRYFLGGWE